MTHTADNRAHLENKQDSAALIETIMGLVGQIKQRAEAEDDEERQWMVQNCGNPAAAELLQDMTLMELHVLDAVGQLEPVNGITISKHFGIFKGTVSKITRRLAAKNLIRKEFLPHNKKEILFKTTPLGKEIFHLHQALHRQMKIGVVQFLQKYDDQELQFLARALREALETSWVRPESQNQMNE